MKMARLPLTISSLPCVPATVRRPSIVADYVIRQYRHRGLAELLRDLQAEPVEQMTITGGIGTLTLHADGRQDWQPTPTIPAHVRPSAPAPRPADPALAAARRATCAACDAWRDRCTASGCGCAGEGKPEVLSSRCPLARWPSV